MKLAAVILSGGKNSRMNGNRKFFLEHDGESFGMHIYRILSENERIEKVYLSVNVTEPYENLGIELIPDKYDAIGPMGGILSAMKYIDAEAILVAACDMPFLSGQAVDAVIDAYAAQKKAVAAATQGQIHPLLAVYPKSMLPDFEEREAQKAYKLRRLIEEMAQLHKVVFVELDRETKAVENINTITEYQNLNAEKHTAK